MPSFWDYINPFGGKKNPARGINKLGQKFLTGTPEERENVSSLRPEQEQLYQQLINAGMDPGAGGAFGESADYYRGLLGNNSADFNAFSAPALRQYNEDIVPGISEQFAGMGSGGLSSSGFRNAQIQGATDLAERLGALRANLRQAGAQGLQNIGQMGLGNFSQNMVTKQGSGGLLGSIGPAIGTAAGAALGGPAGAAIGGGIGSGFSNWMSPQSNQANVFGSTSPYGQQGPRASPQMTNNGGLQLPNFMNRMR